MKAPEKIYLFENPIDNTPDYRWLSKRSGDEDVEYTRTDVFIDKAVSYLNSKLYDWVRIEHSNPSVSPELIIKQDFIEDFKNYMKEDKI